MLWISGGFKNTFWLHLCFSMALLVVGMWCSSGTLSPYAATHHEPIVTKKCQYLLNLDHHMHKGPYLMLRGDEPAAWKESVVLRRVLYPLLAFPFMQWFGFLTGGLLANIFITVAACTVFVSYIRRQYGSSAAKGAMWLLATYPGIMYWGGLPYSYAVIVPFSLLAFLALDHLARNSGVKAAVVTGSTIGILCLGYDLMPFFGFGMILLLAWQRRWLHLPVAGTLMIFPSILTVAYLSLAYGVSPVNSNSISYANILRSYVTLPDWTAWWELLRLAPEIFISNFLESNFIVFPILFFLVSLLSRLCLTQRLTQSESVVLLAVFFVFLFNNLAPPYSGWQLRGEWIARIYQPLFVVILVYTARSFSLVEREDRRIRSPLLSLAVFAVIFNGVIVFGPVTGVGLASTVYHRFYRHSPHPNALTNNVKKYGARPLGICRTSNPQPDPKPH